MFTGDDELRGLGRARKGAEQSLHGADIIVLVYQELQPLQPAVRQLAAMDRHLGIVAHARKCPGKEPHVRFSVIAGESLVHAHAGTRPTGRKEAIHEKGRFGHEGEGD